jgi:hypothetical protein
MTATGITAGFHHHHLHFPQKLGIRPKPIILAFDRYGTAETSLDPKTFVPVDLENLREHPLQAMNQRIDIQKQQRPNTRLNPCIPRKPESRYHNI